MTQQYKQRPFIYRSREDIDAFLKESQLWRDIYEVFLRVKDNAYYLKVPSVKMFNEVRYQCVRLMLDKHPEENVYANYLNDARDTLGWRYASDLCFSMVYAVLSLLNPQMKDNNGIVAGGRVTAKVALTDDQVSNVSTTAFAGKGGITNGIQSSMA